MADAAGEKGTDEEYVVHLVSLIMTRAVAQAEGGPQRCPVSTRIFCLETSYPFFVAGRY